jgi:hypothetical protein
MNRVETSKANLDLRLVDILQQHEIAISILKEYPDGLERFKLAINNESHGPTEPTAADTPTTRQEVNVYESRVRSQR